jgi:succinyl-diaminopimelate desuccinylase
MDRTTFEVIEVLSKLVSFRSITPKGKDALDFIADYLLPLGFKSIIKHFDPKNEVANLYASLGDSKPNICFAGHIDVVPPLNESSWTYDPFVLKVVDDRLYGRGTVDMKGAIACALVAASEYVRQYNNISGAISFLFTTDEEGEGVYGIPKMLEYMVSNVTVPDFCILGEPTTKRAIGDTIKMGRRGSINFRLKLIGTAGHVAYPQYANNPFKLLEPVLNALIHLQLDSGTEYFEPSCLEITSIKDDNQAVNMIPESVDVLFNVRFNDLHSPNNLSSLINKLISSITKNYSLDFVCNALPFIQHHSENIRLFSEIIYDNIGIKPSIDTNGGTSDARFIYKYTEVVEFGLHADLAHKIDEYTKISDLQKLYKVYYNSLIKFLSK